MIISPIEWREEPGVEFWTANYKFEWTFENCTRELLENSPVKLLSNPFGDNRWQISVGTIAKTPGYLGVFLGAAQDIELLTSKTWIRRCESCTATLGTPLSRGAYGINKNISGGYTFNASLESRRGQAKYIKLDKLFVDPAFIIEKALLVEVTLSERRRTTQPSPFGDIQRFAGRSARFSTLFDDPECSDVCFVFPKRKGKGVRTIYAQKYIIRSLPYFNTMFESGFLESGETHSQADSADAAEISLSPALMQFEELSNSSSTFAAQLGAEGSTTASIADDSAMTDGPGVLIDSCTYDEDDSDFELDDLDDLMRGVQQAADHLTLADVGNLSDGQQFLGPVTNDRPSKKRRISQLADKQNQTDDDIEVDDTAPKKGIHRVTITSTPYTTYRALLLYIYSNSIAWAPLRSNWLVHKQRMESKGRSPGRRAAFVREHAVKFSLAMEMDELQPTSPKSMFVLADMLQLPELRQEALDQFMRSLQVDNICIELGSSFLGKYDRVRQLAFDFLKNNWKSVIQTTSFNMLLDEGLGNVAAPVRADFQKLFKCLEVSPSSGPAAAKTNSGGAPHNAQLAGNPAAPGNHLHMRAPAAPAALPPGALPMIHHPPVHYPHHH
ncbi:hypothetical protein PCANC_18117 [Puccinia coronata f. sp. avenae]|uniref:BTB domain-containing protein n=1 Tax=Puccinia coronata f. sp. avenae TaxID=200324 RepID=A0A2N5SLA1_9BASI|nr:hypothetical protein PCANC_18117 [Puccinia coronata f. sp. avenae]PLW16787.1 hypothetical protein PCASD_17175 [Puccinia coronata f. sp. avenae]PLW48584.1 hypothetical protein PCASD_03395 [Puccinia coronata f. sp. avenae]